jgi:hypothetical protein
MEATSVMSGSRVKCALVTSITPRASPVLRDGRASQWWMPMMRATAADDGPVVGGHECRVQGIERALSRRSVEVTWGSMIDRPQTRCRLRPLVAQEGIDVMP